MAYISMQNMNVFRQEKQTYTQAGGIKFLQPHTTYTYTRYIHIHTLTGQAKCKLTTKTTYTRMEYTQNTSIHELNAHTQDSASENIHQIIKQGEEIFSTSRNTHAQHKYIMIHIQKAEVYTRTHTLKQTYHKSEQKNHHGEDEWKHSYIYTYIIYVKKESTC
jgi:hypothetical protein